MTAFSSLKGLVTVAVWFGYAAGVGLLFLIMFGVWLVLGEVYDTIQNREWWIDHEDRIWGWGITLVVAGVIFWIGGSHHGWGLTFLGIR